MSTLPASPRLFTKGKAKYDKYAQLTPKQIQVLQSCANGEAYRETAKVMNLSPDYIKNLSHRAQVFLGCDNRTHAVAVALRRGLIQ